MVNTHDEKYFKNIETYKLGEDIQPKAGEDFANLRHPYGCNGTCENNDNKTRFICLTCRPGKYARDGYVDYC